MKKINWLNALKKFGLWTGDVLRSNQATIVGGMTMIGFALLCRKLNIPYQVLTDPFVGGGKRNTYYGNDSGKVSQFIYLPSDAIEASIAAIYDGALNANFDTQRTAAAREIFNILVARKDDISDATKTYAITVLRQIVDEMDFDTGRRQVLTLISKIGKGEL